MRRLSSLGSKSLAHRKGRSVLTGAGIVLGVAILFGVLVANTTTRKGFDLILEDFTGRADVVVGQSGAFDSNLPDGTIERLRALPEVEEVSGGYGFGTVLPEHPSSDDPEESTGIGVSGFVKEEDLKFQNFDLVSGRYPTPGTSELMISLRLSEELDVGIDDTLTIRGEAETRDLRIVGILENKGAGRTGEGRRTYAPLDTVRALGGEPNAYGGASVILREGVDADEWIDRHRDAVSGTRLTNADSIAAGFKQFLDTFGTFLAFFAGITLFVGAFLIYLTLSMAVIERTRMYGTLRALGATRRQVRRIVLLEAGALGFASTIVGLAVGLGLAFGLLRLMASLFDLELPGLIITPGSVISASLVGLIVTLGSAFVPAVRAGRLAPVEAMKGDYARDTRLGRTWIVGLAILVVCTAAAFLLQAEAIESTMVLGILLGAVLLVPLLLRPLASLLGRVTNRIARGVGEIAVLHLAKERSRSAYTLALVMVVMAMLFASGGLYLSVRAAANEIIERQFGADMFVAPETPFRGSLEGTLRDRPDIEQVSPLRFGEVDIIDDGEEKPFFVRIIEPQTYFTVSSYFWVDGEDESAKAALETGGSLLLSEEVADEIEAERGDDVVLETRAGEARLRVEAIYVPPPGASEMTMGISDARKYLSAGDPMGYIVKVPKGTSAEAVAERLEDAIRGVPLETETVTELRSEAQGQVATYFRIVYAILAIAGIVGLLGLANTLAMSVLQRFREIGILRAIGVTRSQAARMVLVESATMGLTAFVLSLPLGWLLTYLVVAGTSEGFGFSMPTIYPWVWIPFVALFGLVIAVLASIAPGRRAARLEVVNALQYE